MHLGSKHHQIWGESVSQSILYLTGALGGGKYGKKEVLLQQLKKKKKKGVSVLRRPQEAQTGYDQNLCIDILSLKVRQQKLRSIFQHTEKKEKCIIDKNVKGHFII